MASRGDVVKPELNANEFAVYHRNREGDLDFRYPWDHVITTCVVKSSKICQTMLGQIKVRRAFEAVAKDTCEHHPKAWFLGGRPSTEKECENVSIIFLGKIARRFPSLIVDDSVRDPGHLTATWRLGWEEEFDPSSQYIMLNGPVREARASFDATDS